MGVRLDKMVGSGYFTNGEARIGVVSGSQFGFAWLKQTLSVLLGPEINAYA